MVIGESLGIELSRNPEHAERLTPKYASLVLFHSFRHSQGVEEIQRDIFSYIHIIRPEWRITPEDRPGILAGSKEMIYAFLYGNAHERKEGVTLHDSHVTKDIVLVNNAIMRQLDDMERQFNDKKSEKKRKLIQIISDLITNTDLHYLLEDDGRERGPESEKPLMDPWLSFIVHFGLNGNSTRIAELDQMYGEMRTFVLSNSMSDETKKSLDMVIKIYRKKHPKAKINLQP